ncbi:MAG: hypothetical protein M3O82_08590, partial [Verrucomicrobiota bacterium]|nr:hypothetical protein [Verrucomicrobiota bacterium]
MVPGVLSAQELRTHPTPFSVWLDFKTRVTAQSYPIWLQSVEKTTAKSPDGASNAVFRIRFRRIEGINDQISLRLFFDDLKNSAPVVTAWSELGMRMFGSEALGSGTGLETSETITVPMSGVDYLEITSRGDGSGVRGAFLSTLKKTETLAAIDFEKTSEGVDPFENVTMSTPAKDDTYLFGRVKATLEPSIIKLESFNGFSSAFEFELERQPLVALVTFEVLDPEIAMTPEVIVNNSLAGTASMFLPDLADPAYRGAVYA